MRRILNVFALALLMVLASISLCSADSIEYEVAIVVDCYENMIFSTYDVDVFIDNEKIGEVLHGEEKTFKVKLLSGLHEIMFTKHGNVNVMGKTTFELTMDQRFVFSISCYSGEVSIDDEDVQILITDERRELQRILETEIPQQTAMRVAVVAMTNAQATDVFRPDGNTYDTSKFHDYGDYSGFFLAVVEEGNWWAVDGKTWRVDDMLFIMSGTGVYMQAGMNICFENGRYRVSSVEMVIGGLYDIRNNRSDKLNYASYEPSDQTPYLFVDRELITVDRDTDALEDWLHRTTPTDARTRWIDNQFGLLKGNHKALEKLIKESLNDERSYKHIETTYIDITTQDKLNDVNNALKQLGETARAQMGDLLIITEFSAKNSYNATIKATAYGLVSFQNSTVTLLEITY